MMNFDPYSLVGDENTPPKRVFSDTATGKSDIAVNALNYGMSSGSVVEAARRAAEAQRKLQEEADRRSQGSLMGQIFGGVASAGLSMIPGVGRIAAAAGGPLVSSMFG